MHSGKRLLVLILRATRAALDGCFPFNTNYWHKGVFIDWNTTIPFEVVASRRNPR
jgi:hypothetical protein